MLAVEHRMIGIIIAICIVAFSLGIIVLRYLLRKRKNENE